MDYNSAETIKCIHCDGTKVNTGHTGGAVRTLELLLNKELQWCVCVKHLVELVLHTIFVLVDGKTTGPDSYEGPIGKVISDKKGLPEVPMANFIPIDGQIPDVPDHLLHNNDVKMFYRFAKLCQEGPNSSFRAFYHLKPGKVSNARWITTACNICKLYTQRPLAWKNLALLVKVVLNIYGPIIFNTMTKWHISYGPIHFTHILTSSRQLLQGEHQHILDAVFKTLINNPYMAHPENVLLTMVTLDEPGDPTVQENALQIIKKARKRKNKIPRKFKMEKNFINFEATSYKNLVNWYLIKQSKFSSPPLLRGYSLKDIKNRNFNDSYWKIPCHSQSVEKAVADTTFYSEKLIGTEKVHAAILNRQDSMSKIPTDSTKKDFLSLPDN